MGTNVGEESCGGGFEKCGRALLQQKISAITAAEVLEDHAEGEKISAPQVRSMEKEKADIAGGWEDVMQSHQEVTESLVQSIERHQGSDKADPAEYEVAAPDWRTNEPLEIQIKYVVCDAPGSQTVSNSVTDSVLEEQTKVLNVAFAGKTPCPKQPQYNPRKTDARISFNQMGIERVHHEACRSDCYGQAGEKSSEIVPYEPGMIKILVCSTEKEGSGEFYNTGRDVAQKQQDSWVLAGPGFLPGRSKTNYNKGATVVHSN